MKAPGREQTDVPGADFVVLVDTREQRPWNFEEGVGVEPRHLETGDYSVRGLEGRVAIERKSPEDFLETMVRRRDAFCAELRRMSSVDLRAVVVECSLERLASGEYGHVHPEAISGWVASIIVDFRVPVYTPGPRHVAAPFALRLMQRYATRVGIPPAWAG